MTKDKARMILERWITTRVEAAHVQYHKTFYLPVTDELIWTNPEDPFDQWSFKGLIKLAYDL